jgi:hypothetical protein
MKVGDLVRVVWTDELVITGSYVGRRRGYEVFVDDKNEQFVCHPSHIKIFEVIDESS